MIKHGLERLNQLTLFIILLLAANLVCGQEPPEKSPGIEAADAGTPAGNAGSPSQGTSQDDSSQVILLPDHPVPPPAPVVPSEATASRYAHPAPIRWLLSKGAVLVEEYPAVGGLRAFLMRSRQGRQEMFYVTPDGNHMILGTLYTREGQRVHPSTTGTASGEVSGGLPSKLAVGDSGPAVRDEALWEALGAARWIEEGGGDRLVYILIDPHCPHCRRLWASLRPQINNNSLRVRWVPASVLTPDGGPRVAGLLADPSPQRLAAAMQGQSLPPVQLTPELDETLTLHAALLILSGQTSVPTYVYKQGNTLVVGAGTQLGL